MSDVVDARFAERSDDWIRHVRGQGLTPSRRSTLRACGPCPFYPPCDHEATMPDGGETVIATNLGYLGIAVLGGTLLGVAMAVIEAKMRGKR